MRDKHVPGTWTLLGTLVHAKGYRIAEMLGEKQHGEANAQLITAAPDLLAALEGVLAIADRDTKEFEIARAAIRKAKGQQ